MVHNAITSLTIAVQLNVILLELIGGAAHLAVQLQAPKLLIAVVTYEKARARDCEVPRSWRR